MIQHWISMENYLIKKKEEKHKIYKRLEEFFTDIYCRVI